MRRCIPVDCTYFAAALFVHVHFYGSVEGWTWSWALRSNKNLGKFDIL